MPDAAQPPFRADHVGSLLRPPELHEARAKAAAGAITRAELRAIEDRAIREIVAFQEGIGLPAVTDGEFRRTLWHVDFLSGFDGIEATQASFSVPFKGETGETANTPSVLYVKDKLRRRKPIAVADFAYLRSVAKHTPKLCIPAPTTLHYRAGRKAVSEKAYPDIEEFWADFIRAYREEIDDLVAAGCTYLQFDDVSFAYFCDREIREQVRRAGEDPDRLPGQYADIISKIIAGRPPSLRVTMHTCRGNHQSMWRASGGYEPIAEAVFGTAAVDGFFLEFDSDRAGGFEPLRFVPKGKKVVLGLVTTKTPEIESKDTLKRRIEAAAKFVPLEDLCLSPQCGFASSHLGNRITPEVERRKLERIIEVATEVWGTAF